jgi:hypothetical protein
MRAVLVRKNLYRWRGFVVEQRREVGEVYYGPAVVAFETNSGSAQW